MYKFENTPTRIHELKAYKTANGHCDVPKTGEDVPLWRWCSKMRGLYKKTNCLMKRFSA